MLRRTLTLLLVLTSPLSFAGDEDLRDGQTRTNAQGQLQAWDKEGSRWLDISGFWKAYADRKGGYTYGPTSEYPPYDQVNELDTLLIQTAHGDCLMEFFHSRWRRANDVRRWDPAFNEHAGCARVFD